MRIRSSDLRIRSELGNNFSKKTTTKRIRYARTHERRKTNKHEQKRLSNLLIKALVGGVRVHGQKPKCSKKKGAKKPNTHSPQNNKKAIGKKIKKQQRKKNRRVGEKYTIDEHKKPMVKNKKKEEKRVNAAPQKRPHIIQKQQ